MRRWMLLTAVVSSTVLVTGLSAPTGAASTEDAGDGPIGAAALSADACGEAVLKPTGEAWECTLVDDFAGTTLDDAVWTAHDQAGNPGGACYRDDPRTVRVADGVLSLSVLPAGPDLVCPARVGGARNAYAGASVSTAHKWSQQYGRFEARIKAQATPYPGLQESFWLWPDERYTKTWNWPASGEIDISETYSSHPDLSVPFVHYWASIFGARPGINTSWKCQATRGEWHTYTLEWTATAVEIFVDGTLCLRNTAGATALRKRFIVSLTQMLGSEANAYDGRAALPATMQVDYVKVWS